MDIKELDGNFKGKRALGAFPEEAQNGFQNLENNALLVEEIILRDREIRNRFKIVRDTVGSDHLPYGGGHSSLIKVAMVTDPELGDGYLLAQLVQYKDRPFLDEFEVRFKFESPNGELDVVTEHYASTIAQFEEAKRNHWSDVSYSYKGYAHQLGREYPKNIAAIISAEETFDMIESALADETLNPEYAPKWLEANR